ncbi:uncharacterized protein LOC115455259 [Manduca sexta]|uniref:uncharacterized protein LOC115455259 n=1 Tax=Manduca sexta TaxID=7130 RepID=UPI00188E1402|nr:uncharacterized protein LOC115455259 [Manduca sexta]
MAYRKCVICGLRSERKDGIKRYFIARFPLDERRCKEWVKMAGNEDLAYLPIEKLNQLKFVCGKHFKNSDFKKKGTQLKKTAVPSIRLTSKPLPDSILAEFPCHLFKEQVSREDEPSTSSIPQPHVPPILEQPLHSFTQHEEIATIEEAYHIFNEDDVPPVQYTVNITTSEQCTIKKDVPSTSSMDFLPIKSTELTLDGSKKAAQIKSRRPEKMYDQNVSPRKKKLMKKVEHLKSKMRIFKKKAKMFDNIESKFLKTMMFSAIRNQNRSVQGKRWSEDEKALAIAMYKKSPKLYRYLRHLLPLPSPRTLQNVLSKMPIHPGFNKVVIDHLKRKANELSGKNKTCVILFDEMSLKKRLIFNSANDKVEGYEDLGEHGRSGNLADKALVLLLQGVHKNFKQPLAHYFVKGTISSEKLVAIIKNAIKIVTEIGFKVIATVCDQGPTNVGALNLLKSYLDNPLIVTLTWRIMREFI